MGAFGLISQSLKKFTDFKSRASRAEFWTFFFFVLGAQAVARLVDIMLGSGPFGGPVSMLSSLLLFVPQVSVAVRRLHDVNRSGRELLVPCLLLLASPLLVLFASFLGKIVALGFAAVTMLMFGRLLLMLARQGSRIPNRYGACPTAFSFAR